jgi:hypothetical protein
MWMHVVMEERYTGGQHSMPLFWMALRNFFCYFQCTSDIMVPCWLDSTTNTPLLYQKAVAINLAYDVCLNFFGVFGECVRIHCSGFNIHKWNQVSSPITCMMWLWNSSPFLWYHSKEVLKPFFLEHYRNQPCREQCMKFVEKAHKNSEIWSTRLSRIFGQHFEQDHYPLQMACYFTPHCEHLFTHFWTFYTIILQFLHSYFGCELCNTHDGCLQDTS